MKNNIYSYEILDIDLKESARVSVKCKQLDDIVLLFDIYNNGVSENIENYDIELRVTKPDGKLVIQDTEMVKKENNIKIECLQDITREKGKAVGELRFVNSNNKQKTSFDIVIDIKPSVLDGSNGVSSNVVTVLEKLDTALDNGKELHNTLTSDINTGKTLHNTLTSDINTGKELHNTLTSDINTGNSLHGILTTDISRGDSLHISLTSKITTGNTLHSNLISDINTGNTLHNTLLKDINDGNATDTKLKSNITTGNTLHSNLTSDITTGNTLHSNLTSKITTGNTLHNTLLKDINDGNATDTKLKESILEGTRVKTELEKWVLDNQDIVIINEKVVELDKNKIGQTTKAMKIYVSTTGDNTSGTGLISSPYKTIGKALSTLPKYINHTVEIIVSTGTYSETVSIEGFLGAGEIKLLGSTSLVETFRVSAIHVKSCTCRILVTGFTSISSIVNFYAQCCSRVVFTFCTSLTYSVSASAFEIHSSNCEVKQCSARNRAYALYVSGCSIVYSDSWDSNSTKNQHALFCVEASKIGKNGNQPRGDIADETISKGGQII